VESTAFIAITPNDQHRQRLRRRWRRIGIPVTCVVVMLGAILAIATFSYQRNRRDALALSDDLLRELQHRIASEVRGYLTPAADMARLAAGMLQSQTFGSDFPALTEVLTIHVLAHYPQLVMAYVADPQGNFLMTRRMPDGSTHTKRIERRDTTARVTWHRRNPQGEVIAVEDVEDDGYDPRLRPWYGGAVSTGRQYWSDVYIFFTDQKPGVTVSQPIITDNGELRGVLGLDIDLEQLSAFLAGLRIGRSGRAMIIDEAGRLVASPDLARMFKKVGDSLQPARLDELGDAVLTRAFNYFRIEGYGHRTLNVDRRRYSSTASSLHTTVGRNWSMLIVVPEEDFVGFVARNNRQALAMGLVVVGLAALLAGLLVAQGLRADRNAQLVLERQQQLEAQSRAFSELASQAALFDPEDADSLVSLTDIASGTVGVRRVSLWRLIDGGAWLVCDNCYDRESGGHTQGSRLARDDLPQLFEVIDRADELVVRQADSDPRTAELHRVYLQPFGCEALLAVPIVSRGTPIGSVWFEDERRAAAWSPETCTFARAIAGMLALRLSATVRAVPDSVVVALPQPYTDAVSQASEAPEASVVPQEAVGAASPGFVPRRAMRTTAIADDRASVFMARLATRGLDRHTLGAHIYADTTVLVCQFTDPLSLAERSDDEVATSVVDRLVHHLEDLAAVHGIEYLKIMGTEIVCAAGFDGNPEHGAGVLAAVALDMQERCLRLFADLSTHLEFRMGMDTGVVIGSPVGRGEPSYNLWGEAVRAAQWMAETSLAGGIQVTESTYRRLRHSYLFKVRGTYYLQDVGELSTYLMTGRT
jgi:class 3 adenylate cyclase